MRLALLAALVCLAHPALAAPFDISSSYAGRADVPPGAYACRSGLDMASFTWTFDVAGDAYAVRGIADPEGRFALDAEGTLAFASGPFAPDDTATMHGRAVTRLSDGNPTIILGYFFADGETSYDYCARLD